MPRYFFNIVNDVVALDREGLILPDQKAAESLANQMAQTLRTRGPEALAVFVTDTDGVELYRTTIAG